MIEKLPFIAAPSMRRASGRELFVWVKKETVLFVSFGGLAANTFGLLPFRQNNKTILLGMQKGDSMKLIHISDLHLGKKVCGYSMLEEQKDALQQVLNVAEENKAAGVLAAGDVYDKGIPSTEAVELLNWFLQELSARGIPLLMISGNHDSAIRLSFASELLEKSRIYIAGGWDGKLPYADLEEDGQRVRVHLLSFLKPSSVRPYTDREVNTYQQAFSLAINQAERDRGAVNILMAHQFFAGSRTCESEALIVGGLDQISADLLDSFDYVALGHLHSPQRAGRRGYYCGSLLKYSPSEANQTKSIALLNIEDNQLSMKTIPVKPLHDIKKIRGTYEELTALSFVKNQNPEDYYVVEMTDEMPIPGAFSKLQTFYPGLMQLNCPSLQSKQSAEDLSCAEQAESKSPLELTEDFYAERRGREMSNYQKKVLQELLEDLHASR